MFGLSLFRPSRQSNISTSGEERFKYPLPWENKISQMPYPRENKGNQIPTLCPVPPPPPPPVGYTLIGALSCLKSNQFAPQIKSCSKWQSCQKVAPNSKSFQKVAEQLVAKASPFKAVEGRKYGHETSKFLRWIKNQRFLAMGLRSSACNSAILLFGIWLRLIHCPVIVG